jgi:outer membrane protein assembly factor BamB
MTISTTWLHKACIGIVLLINVIDASAGKLPEWNNYQGNAAHTGYVPARFNPANFRVIWNWTSPHSSDGVTPFINPVTISKGLIAVTDDDYFSPQALYVLDEATGTILWQYEFPADTPALNPPTINNGKIFVATSGHSDTFMHQFDAYSGNLLWQTPFDAQWEHYLAPTVYRHRYLHIFLL